MKLSINDSHVSNSFFNENNKQKIIANLNNEYHSRYREYFESVFAIQLMKSPELFPVVEKVSSAILMLIQTNKDNILSLFDKNNNIRQDLLDQNLHGALKAEDDNSKLLDNIISILQNQKSDLNNKILIHFAFMRYIFPVIKQSNMTPGHISKETIAAISYFRDRPRQERKDSDVRSNNHLGITKNMTFQNMIKDTSTMRIRPVDKYIPREESAYFMKYPVKEIPFVAGPSGHTAVLLSGAITYCGLTEAEEMKQYAAACFAHLTSGGCHNFHEIYSAANQLCSIPYELNNYQHSLPESVITSDLYQKLCNEFPQFLERSDKPALSYQLK